MMFSFDVEVWGIILGKLGETKAESAANMKLLFLSKRLTWLDALSEQLAKGALGSLCLAMSFFGFVFFLKESYQTNTVFVW